MKGFTKESAFVLSYKDGNLLVRMPLNDDSGGCGGCTICQMCDAEKNKFIDLNVSLSEDVAPPSVGDRVLIEYRRRDPGLAAVAFFLPPLVGLVGGGFLFRWAGGVSDTHFLIGALTFFFVGIGVAWVFSQAFPSLIRPEARLADRDY